MIPDYLKTGWLYAWRTILTFVLGAGTGAAAILTTSGDVPFHVGLISVVYMLIVSTLSAGVYYIEQSKARAATRRVGDYAELNIAYEELKDDIGTLRDSLPEPVVSD